MQFMRNSAPVENQVEYSFELNAHNKALLDQIKNAKRRSEALRRYPGSFAETLVALQKEKKLSNKQLADRSLVGEKTIQRLRNDEEYPTSVQTVFALCVGLKLPLPEAEMFLGKTDFKLNSMKNEGYVYQCVLAACAENSIYEINEMLKENGTHMQAWSPFACAKNNFFNNPVLKEIGEKYGKTTGQVGLKYLVQTGVSVIPKSSKTERLKENLNIFDFNLTNEDVEKIMSLDRGKTLFGWY